jgi:hypothetical protein
VTAPTLAEENITTTPLLVLSPASIVILQNGKYFYCYALAGVVTCK